MTPFPHPCTIDLPNLTLPVNPSVPTKGNVLKNLSKLQTHEIEQLDPHYIGNLLRPLPQHLVRLLSIDRKLPPVLRLARLKLHVLPMLLEQTETFLLPVPLTTVPTPPTTALPPTLLTKVFIEAGVASPSSQFCSPYYITKSIARNSPRWTFIDRDKAAKAGTNTPATACFSPDRLVRRPN